MKKYVLMFLIGFLLVLGTSTLAQNSSDVKPGLLPDHPLVVFQDFFERLQVFFAFTPETRARVHIQLAEKRLAELNLAMEQNKTNLVPHLSEKFEKELNETEDEVNSAESEGKNVTELAEHVAAETYKHILVLQRVLNKVPDKAKESIEHAIEKSSHGHENAVEKILEHGNITGTVNITFTIENQTFTQTFNVTIEKNKTHVEKEGEHNETCEEEKCNESKVVIIQKPENKHEWGEETTTSIVNTTANTSTTTTTRGRSGED